MILIEGEEERELIFIYGCNINHETEKQLHCVDHALLVQSLMRDIYSNGWRISDTQEPHWRCLTPLNFFDCTILPLLAGAPARYKFVGVIEKER